MQLTPKAFLDVLRYLVEHADRVVTQDELLEAIWPKTYVNPEGIRKYILEIRKSLGDQKSPPSFIETLPKRGYRFIAKVAEERKLALPASAGGPAGTIVGRDEALAEIEDCLKTASDGQRQIVFVTGEAGIGKTDFGRCLRTNTCAACRMFGLRADSVLRASEESKPTIRCSKRSVHS